jgi:hypothetical protein
VKINDNIYQADFGNGDRNQGSGGSSGGGTGGGGMEQRIANLERDMSVIKATMATKEDLNEVKIELMGFKVEVHSLLRQNIMWSIGTIVAMGGLVFAIMRFAGS